MVDTFEVETFSFKAIHRPCFAEAATPRRSYTDCTDSKELMPCEQVFTYSPLDLLEVSTICSRLNNSSVLCDALRGRLLRRMWFQRCVTHFGVTIGTLSADHKGVIKRSINTINGVRPRRVSHETSSRRSAPRIMPMVCRVPGCLIRLRRALASSIARTDIASERHERSYAQIPRATLAPVNGNAHRPCPA